MNSLKSITQCALRSGTLQKNKTIPFVNKNFVRYRRPSQCDLWLKPPDKQDCFDIRRVSLERGNECHSNMIKCFLNTHFWPREPSVVGLWMSLDSPYLEVLTDKYASSGDRLLAFENIPRTGERKLIGLAIGNRVHPWVADELEEWAHHTESRPERNRMYFCAHCLRAPNLFHKYHVNSIYEIEIVATAAEVTGHGIGQLLLRRALEMAFEVKHDLIQVIAVNAYMARICEKVRMKREWSMNYSDYVDVHGQRVFYPRRPHHSVTVYTSKYDLKKALRKKYNPSEPCE